MGPAEGGGCVWIVHRTCPAIDPKLPPLPPPTDFRGKTEQDLINGDRALLWGEAEDGSIIFQETPAQVRKNAGSSSARARESC